ncbi:DedA family protein [Corynebacterium aquilae]|uniref:Membrane protein n=1 Tax=Corynebacterium aquilae DSM 44791 TaxID=1431546 RepID=A0A1L7CFX5_9CORY|nr:DedA family protein [Corynebacterium aquilae]APT84726.1 membrane protein [Corynebacterium aquilae DSM 44791]
MFDVDMLLSSFGLLGILIIVFMETGLLIGFIFPGDTLLFTAGMMAHADPPFTPLWTLMVGIPIAAMLGDQLGYFIGRKVGPAIIHTRAMQWIGPEAVEKSHHFFDRFGAATVFLARFIAVVRTVTPVVAGFSHMDHRKFTFYSVLGSAAWGGLIPLFGYLLGEIPIVQKYMHWFILAGLATLLIPFGYQVYNIIKKQRQHQNHTPPTPAEATTPNQS